MGLRTRVAAAFAVLSLMVGGTVSLATYAVASWYLVSQRESAALTRAVLDSRAAGAALATGATPSEALVVIPSVGTSQPMLRVDGTWFTAGVTVPPDELPITLLDAGESGGATQRTSVGDEPYYVAAIPIGAALYVEVFPLQDLDQILVWGAFTLVGLTLLAGVIGAVIGATAVGRLLRPVRRLGVAAQRIAGGELSTRIELTGDRDLDPIAESFNDMAGAVQTRIARERRFSGNVSHELRSPITAALGTAELLEARSDRLPEREAGLIAVLAQQVRRMSTMLLDLLEISRIGSDDPPQWESADIARLCREVVAMRGLDAAMISGTEPVVRTDARRFERIIGNLVDNAQNHGEGLRSIIIDTDARSVRIKVDDAGPGVDAALRDRLFEPFARGSAAHRTQGAGLGLAIALEQAHILGGTLWVEASPLGGARFVAQLPITQDST